MNRAYLSESYQKSVETCIESVELIDGATAFTCSELIFHPEGGGQPNDRGTVLLGNSTYAVKKLLKRKGDVFIVLDSKIPSHDDLFFGETVTCNLDWDYRYKAMRYHSAAHALMAATKRAISDYQPKGIVIADDLSSCQIRFSGSNGVSPETANRIFEIFNSALKKDLPITAQTYPNVDEAKARNPEIFRMDPALQLKGSIRVVVINGFDANPCGGTHVQRLSEIRAIKLVSVDDSALSFTL